MIASTTVIQLEVLWLTYVLTARNLEIEVCCQSITSSQTPAQSQLNSCPAPPAAHNHPRLPFSTTAATLAFTRAREDSYDVPYALSSLVSFTSPTGLPSPSLAQRPPLLTTTSADKSYATTSRNTVLCLGSAEGADPGVAGCGE